MDTLSALGVGVLKNMLPAFEFLLRTLLSVFTPAFVVFVRVWNILYPVLFACAFVLWDIFRLPVVWAVIVLTSGACVVWRNALLLEREFDAAVSRAVTARRRRALAAAVGDPRSYLYLAPGPPRAVSADVLSMVDELLVVQFELRRWLAETLLLPLVLNPL